ncbi:hypothetical protein OPV22_017175 [Ensete ventricosum]|uniref:Cation/H+ exchanger domain-containing protein n=1 Tax=Ensete ventricosum TaxID=4639 RepID=A0AAV8PF02_ENSVE|nr:hypothetical protein OPV22_017175 [Ensete ventricosum]
MAINITAIKTSSNGVWQGDNPLHFAFPLLIVQTTLVLLVSRSLSFLLKPLRQPKVIAEIIGGILLGPSALGRNKTYLHNVFPAWSEPILETVASIGLLFFLFLVGLELDLHSIRRSGRRAFSIAAAGITLPFACGVGVAFVLRHVVSGADEAGYGPFLVFMGVALSITAFPVLARILAELRLLNTQLGETAMAAAAFNDLAAWVLLAVAVAISGGSGSHRSPVVSLWVLLTGLVFVSVQMVVVRPAMAWVARRAESAGGESEVWVALTLAGVLVSGFFTDFIGIHSIFGAFIFGLTVPKEGDFAGRLTERIEDFVSVLLLPLYFASSGLKTNVASIKDATSWGILALVICTACVGKIIGTFVAAMACRMAPREAMMLGVLMNTKGLVELIVLNIGKERKVLNDEVFAIMVLMALFTTFITTPIVMAIYKPARSGRYTHEHRKLHRAAASSVTDPKELRVLACVHSPGDVPSLIGLLDTICGGATKRCPLKFYALNLVELTERPSSIVMARRSGLPFRFRREARDQVALAFQAYGQLGRVHVRSMTAVSSKAAMHEDVRDVAEQKRVSLLIVPFHKHQHRRDGAMENEGPGWRAVNQRVMREAPCSVAVLVDRGFGGGGQVGPAEVAREICVVFFGGPDDREALALAGRMAQHPGVRVTAVRIVPEKKGDVERRNVTLRPSPLKNADESYTFSTAVMDRQREKEMDEAAVAAFQKKTEGGTARYQKRPAGNVIEAVLEIGKSGEFELVVVGKGRFPTSMVAEIAEQPAEHPELGPVGDVLASSSHGIASSVLVIQQHDTVHSEETPVSVVVDDDSAVVDIATPTIDPANRELTHS